VRYLVLIIKDEKMTLSYACLRYGIFYDGGEPVLYVRDPDLVKQITIRDFDHFMDFGFGPLIARDMKANDLGLLNATGEEWKKLKRAISPAFSLKNLRSATKIINNVRIKIMSLFNHLIHLLCVHIKSIIHLLYVDGNEGSGPCEREC